MDKEDKIRECQLLFNSILCLCAEGVEVMERKALYEAIAKDANRGHSICGEVLE